MGYCYTIGMSKRAVLFLGLLALVFAVFMFVSPKLLSAPSEVATEPQDFGTYPYECDEQVMFTMTPSQNLNTILIQPTEDGAYPPRSVLLRNDTFAGTRYEGNGVTFTARGETITLGEGDSAINYSPVPNPDEAPFNFGD